MEKIKKKRSVTLAKNWKMKQLKNIEVLKNEMTNNNINTDLINEFIKEQYDLIDAEFKLKIEKSNNIITKNESIKNRNKDISNLIKNKIILEKNGINKQIINEYLLNEYYLINNKYKINNNIEFLD